MSESFCTETDLQLRLFIAQTFVVCGIFSSSAIQNKIQPLFGIRLKLQNFQLGCFPHVKIIPGYDSVLVTSSEFTASIQLKSKIGLSKNY